MLLKFPWVLSFLDVTIAVITGKSEMMLNTVDSTTSVVLAFFLVLRYLSQQNCNDQIILKINVFPFFLFFGRTSYPLSHCVAL